MFSTSSQSPDKKLFYLKFLYKYFNFSKRSNDVSTGPKIINLTLNLKELSKVFQFEKQKNSTGFKRSRVPIGIYWYWNWQPFNLAKFHAATNEAE